MQIQQKAVRFSHRRMFFSHRRSFHSVIRTFRNVIHFSDIVRFFRLRLLLLLPILSSRARRAPLRSMPLSFSKFFVVNPRERINTAPKVARTAPLRTASPNRISLLLRTARYLAEIEFLFSPLIYASLAGEARSIP